MHDPLLNTVSAAKYLNMEPLTLVAWRTRGEGPTFIKLGKRAIRYKFSDLHDFIEKNSHKHTSSYILGGVK